MSSLHHVEDLSIDLEFQSQESPLEAPYQSTNNRRPYNPPGSRPKRARTANRYQPILHGRKWTPGQEPGIDPSRKHSGSMDSLNSPCSITVCDFSQDDIRTQYLDNSNIRSFLEKPRSDPAGCRWINVDGLSWDVISAIGDAKHFHRLAIEDMIHTRNRTKADWYSDHTYSEGPIVCNWICADAIVVLPLQKLVHIHERDNESPHSELDPLEATPRRNKANRFLNFIQSAVGFQGPGSKDISNFTDPALLNGNNNNILHANVAAKDRVIAPFRSLQQYHGGSNIERTRYMERNSALMAKDLAVGVEQVSIFLTSDNSVVSFFEQSAEDVELPILSRLRSAETVLRRCSDASMIVQAIIDAIIDLAIPVAAAYQDAADGLELDVLTGAFVSFRTSYPTKRISFFL